VEPRGELFYNHSFLSSILPKIHIQQHQNSMSHNIKTVGLIFTRKKIERSGFIGLEDYAM
jgi:hypothetical protein